MRWTRLTVPVDGCTRVNEAVDRMRAAIEDAVAQDADGRLLACRVELTGQTDTHGSLLASTEHLLAEARGAALGLGEELAWIERIVVATRPLLDTATLRAREDALGELQRMLEDAGEDAELHQLLEADIGELVRKLPHELRADPEDAVLKVAVDGDYTKLIDQVSGFLVARITTDGQ